MAPTRHSRIATLTLPSTISTRSKSILSQQNQNVDARFKRKAEGSPAKEIVKRPALGDVTNAIKRGRVNDVKGKTILKQTVQIPQLKRVTAQIKDLPVVKTVQKQKQNENLCPPPAPGVRLNKNQARAVATRTKVPNQTALKPKEKEDLKENVTAKVKTRLSNEFEKTEESLYSTALEEINSSTENEMKIRPQTRASTSSISSTNSSPGERKPSNMTLVAEEMNLKLNLDDHKVPEGVDDFDKENWDDIFQVSHYAMDIFNYLKEREELFEIPEYMERQVCLTTNMRTLLVDWMVEIQESFELNHETLYLGVKLVDIYLSRMTVGKETLQLVGAACMFIASKYDERMPPAVDDFLYICDGAYSRRDLLKMEINIMKVCGFDLGIPISYRFLRRYARCAKVAMPILTLARYILELSLMDYATVKLRDSKLAAAALYLAVQMARVGGWTPTLEYYTGYKLSEFIDVVYVLNNGLHKKPRVQVMTVRNKYSHKIFFEVAKTPLIQNEDLTP